MTEQVICSFRNEANKLGALKHPNVVSVVAVCVRPPDLCLLLECANLAFIETLKAVVRLS